MGILPDLSLEQLRERMVAASVRRLLLKPLAPNDNAKNQPYLSGSMDVVNILPAGEIRIDETKEGNRIMKAPLPLEWLQPLGGSIPAPNAKLILYPQYPEVRFSGFLRGSVNAPSELLTTREPGRLLFFGITDDRRIIGWAAGPGSQLARDVAALGELEAEGVFRRIALSAAKQRDTLDMLLTELRRIHLLDWLASKRMAGGVITPYTAPNGIGYTLQAELGISNNGRAEPDFEGWEVKAKKVLNYRRVPPGEVSTLMTPEPDGGEYTQMPIRDFLRVYGYPDTRGRPDRLNFGGQFRLGDRQALTGLTMHLHGFDAKKGDVSDVDGFIALRNDAGDNIASWSFKKLINLWTKKHAKAAYVPGEMREAGMREYRYGPTVLLGEGTNFNRLMSAVASGAVVYDPGIELKFASTPNSRPKKRSQFRIRWKDLPQLYDTSTTRDLF